MEAKDMKELETGNLEKASGGVESRDPLGQVYKITCPKCGSEDVKYMIMTCKCRKCGYEWHEAIC